MQTIKTVGVVGTGVIGASWAAYFLSQGLHVVATDPGEAAERQLREAVSACWPSLERIGLKSGASPSNLAFDDQVERALADVDFVQESAPERVELKQALLQRIDEATAHDVVIASSSSGLMPSELQARMVRPERLLVAHPYNPPHIVPLVEVVGSEKTSTEAVQKAIAFYSQIGKRPIHVKRERMGHVANRLQAALVREAIYLLAEGVATAEDIDVAVTDGPGLRWALLGPFAVLHFAGGAGGVRYSLEHFGPGFEKWCSDLGAINQISESTRHQIVDGVEEMMRGTDTEKMLKRRDECLVNFLDAKRQWAAEA